MQVSSTPLPADLNTPLHTPAASPSGPLGVHPLLAPNAERLGRWFGERLGHERCWALIVEPHRKIAELMAYILDFELGIQAVSVPGPRLIPSLFRRWVPDLVLAEIPALEGAPSLRDLESLRGVLETAQAQQAPIPVILCTTYMEVTPVLARNAGFAGLIHKPFIPATLVGAVRATLGNNTENRKSLRLPLASG
jgi:DNA-binding response OmpR family regulator